MSLAPVMSGAMIKRREYKLVTTDSSGELSQEVTRLLQDGWELEGGHRTCGKSGYGVTYSQALTRIAPTTKEY